MDGAYPEIAEFTGCTCVRARSDRCEHVAMTVTASGGQGVAALSPSHTCIGGALRPDCFSINLESPHLLQLLGAPPHLVFIATLRAYYELGIGVKKFLVQWFRLKSNFMTKRRSDAILLQTSIVALFEL